MTERSDQSARVVGRDLAVLTTVPVGLAAVHVFVPQSIQDTLALDHADPALHALFTSAFVHNSTSHLASNLIGYVVPAVVALELARAVDRRDWFWRVFAVNLFVVPVVVNVADLLAWGTFYPSAELVARGFSGVVAAFVGSVLVASFVFLSERHGSDVEWVARLVVTLLTLHTFII